MGPSRVSVVVNSCNRAESLAALLAALRHQTYEEFEVVVVRGPCTDGTDEVLAAAGPRLTVVPCPERNLSVSRNLGIRHSAGELVAFVDDDAVPTAGWLEALVEELGDDAVVGAGGVVLDADGFATQYRYSACDGLGRTRFDVEPPLAGLLEPDADLRLYLQGTNQCYRREALVAIGGFDEDLRYGYDEVDLCRRLVGAGGGLAAVDGAPVVHRYLANACRDARGRFLEPFEPVRSRAIFAARHAAPRHRPEDVTAMLAGYRADLADWIGVLRAEGEVDGPRAAAFLADVDRGLEEGLAVGAGPRPPADLEPTEREFLPYAGDRPPSYARICLVSRELPGRGTHGGIARYTADLADAFVAAGHEVHVVTGADDRSEVRFEEGRWLHRLAHNPRRELQGFPVSGPLENALAVWHEVRRILAWGPLHVVSAPIWDCEGLVCGLDPGIPLMTTLVTSFATVAAVHPSWAERPHTRAMIELEARTLQAPGRVHALSAAVLEDARSRGLAAADVRVVPLGVRSPGPAISPARDGTTILFVGRLERRKGVDVLLRAFAAVHRACPEARLVLAGDHTENTELAGRTYEQEFHAGADEDLRAAVEFAGPVSQERLHALYASADVVCAPSRYESFGLVAVEAMAYGRPVVSTSAGGVTEVVGHGVEGLLVPPGDARALGDALVRLCRDPAERRRLGAAARRRFERCYELDAVAARLAEIYREGGAVRPPAPAPREMAARLAAAIGPSGAVASPRIFDPATHPVDVGFALSRLSEVDDAEFVDGANRLLLGRLPTWASRASQTAALRCGGSRRELLAGIARSPEARRRHGTADWLCGVELPSGGLRARLRTRAMGAAVRAGYRLARASGLYALAIDAIRAQASAAAETRYRAARADVERLERRVEQLERALSAAGAGDDPRSAAVGSASSSSTA